MEGGRSFWRGATAVEQENGVFVQFCCVDDMQNWMKVWKSIKDRKDLRLKTSNMDEIKRFKEKIFIESEKKKELSATKVWYFC